MGHSGAALNGAPEKAAPSPQILLLPGPAGAAPPSTTGAHSPTSESYPDIVLLLLPVPRSRATPLLCPSRTDAAETPCPPLIPKISTDPNPAVREEGFRETPSLRYCSSGGGFLRGLAPACEPPVHLPTRTVAHWCPLTTRCLRVARHPLIEDEVVSSASEKEYLIDNIPKSGAGAGREGGGSSAQVLEALYHERPILLRARVFGQVQVRTMSWIISSCTSTVSYKASSFCEMDLFYKHRFLLEVSHFGHGVEDKSLGRDQCQRLRLLYEAAPFAIHSCNDVVGGGQIE